MGASHVYNRTGTCSQRIVLDRYDADCDSYRDQDLQLDLYNVGRLHQVYSGKPILSWFRSNLRYGWGNRRHVSGRAS
ncbi:hypothetical protein D3C79_845460 [compost metagenome]